MTLLIILLASRCTGGDPREKKRKSPGLEGPLSVHSALPQQVKSPKDNPITQAKVELGRLLFFDPILSGDKDIACASCHHPENGYAEYRDLSIGTNGQGFGIKRVFKEPNVIPLVKRNAHTVLNTAFNGIDTRNRYDPEDAPMFWDNRVVSLERQAIEPLLAFEEMRGPNYGEAEILAEVSQRLAAIPKYVQLFSAAFAEPNPIHPENMAKAIAAFERTLVTTDTRFDQYMRGDEEAISLSERDGFLLFNKVGCGKCHNGPMFSDYQAHVVGVPKNKKLTAFDRGIDEDFAFRTPSLRNLRFSAPYMHNGRFNSLKEVLEFYEDISMGKNRHEAVTQEEIDPLIKQLDLRVRDMLPIISFLNTLNDTQFDKKIPRAVPSGLPVGGNID
ncbi:MAG: cytochrome-c peroxidase [Saprospiraceae bacterium]|nr:cytochrome-c peroxidase [Saprospiraceae bacterium]